MPLRVEPVVARRVEMEHAHVLLQERDEGKEERAVQPILVEIVGRHVGRRDDGDAAREQLLEQPAEDHRVGDVVDRELVEAEQLDLRSDRCGDRRDRIVAVRLAALRFGANACDALVHVAHEGMEMDAALRVVGAASKKRSMSSVLPRPTSPQM